MQNKNIIDKATDGFIEWCAKDTPGARFQRSVAQGVIGVVVGGLTTGEWTGAVIVGIVMAVIAPVQKAIGNKGEVDGAA